MRSRERLLPKFDGRRRRGAPYSLNHSTSNGSTSRFTRTDLLESASPLYNRRQPPAGSAPLVRSLACHCPPRCTCVSFPCGCPAPLPVVQLNAVYRRRQRRFESKVSNPASTISGAWLEHLARLRPRQCAAKLLPVRSITRGKSASCLQKREGL